MISSDLLSQSLCQLYLVWQTFLLAMDDPGEEPGLVQTAYGTNYKRLVALKNSYDPSNFFHINQNIKPLEPGWDSMSRAR